MRRSSPHSAAGNWCEMPTGALSVLLVGLLLGWSAPARAQGKPIVGSAQLAASAPPSLGVGSQFVLSVNVDLRGVTGRGESGTTPVVLAAYQIAMTFDKSKLRFDGVGGGSTAEFSSTPTTTDPCTANPAGSLRIVADQASSDSPTGNVNVARLWFTALAQGSTSLNLTALSLSSALQGDFGPANITALGSSVALSIGAASTSGLAGSISFDPSQAIAGEPIEFQAVVNGGSPPYLYSWDFGDGETSTAGSTVQHAYAFEGTYTIRLTVSDNVSASVLVLRTVCVASSTKPDAGRRHAIERH